ncbi:MAG: transporter [Thermodesulfobacteriota bacterium]
MIRTISWTGATLLLLNSAAFAAHPLITEDAGTMGRGVFQLELNGEYGHEDQNGVEVKTTEVAATLSYGVTDRLDLLLGAPYQWLRGEENGETFARENGFGDLSVELKWQFFTRDTFNFALKPGLSLPTGDEHRGLGSGKVAESIFLISTFEAAPFALHANLGSIHNNNDGGEEEKLWHASIAGQYALTDRVTLVANTGIERNPDPDGDTHPAFLLAGLIYAVTENFDVDFGVKAGLNAPETDYTVLAGIAWRL